MYKNVGSYNVQGIPALIWIHFTYLPAISVSFENITGDRIKMEHAKID